jgi:hypothetical protein
MTIAVFFALDILGDSADSGGRLLRKTSRV